MRITFLCSGLEPGRDGVGDYTVRLAGEIVRQGHEASIIALHDRHLVDATCVNPNTAAMMTGPTLRLPSSMRWRERVALTKDHLSSFGAQWVSLQFVPYGFSDKGIVSNLGRNLKLIAGEHLIHVMFHELWIGAYQNAPWKERLVGIIQRVFIQRLHRCLSPAAVATSNGAYVGLLRRIGVPATVLPLFGNIPVLEGNGSGWFDEELKRAGLTSEGEERRSFWIFAFFGALHPIWPPEPLFSYIASAAKSSRKTVVVAAIGRLGPGETLWQRLNRDYGGAFRFLNLSEQPAARISEFLQAVDFGIATSPWALIGKSGSVASMLEHGLPVIVNRDDVQFPDLRECEAASPLLIKMDETLSERLPSLMRLAPRSTLPDVARMFLARIESTPPR